MIVAYARVSTKQQNLERQLKARRFGCDKIYQEMQSDMNFKEHITNNEIRSKMRFGFILVVHDLSRFGRIRWK